MAQKLQDLSGQSFGKLIVIKRVDAPAHIKGNTFWECKCECGKVVTVRGSNLRGSTRSCGCLKKQMVTENNLGHGQACKGRITSEYICWQDLKHRCNNPNNSQYEDYGGRGIKVCDRWANSFENFFADMGKKPDPSLTIERIDTDGDYEPNNCRWATKLEQIRNRRNTFFITYKGETKTAAEWAQITGIPDYCLRGRLNQGWPVDRIFSEPVVARNRTKKNGE